MNASNLVDLAIELINEAKTAQDNKSKIYYLEQVKEILLYRDSSILVGLIPDIMDFMIETSIQVKRFLVKFMGEALKKSSLVSVQVLSLLSFYVSDINDDFIRYVALEFKTIYPQLLMFIVSQPVKSKSATSADPKQLWSQLRIIVEKIIESLSSQKSENTRIECLQVVESIIQFGIPSTESAKVLDPRLKASKKVDVSVVESSSSDIPLHHPFINRNDIEQEAESLISKLLLWASKGGPQGFPFTPNEMSQLGQSIASISSIRHRFLGQATPAVMAILGKTGLCEEMSGLSRENLAKSLHRMMRSLMVQPDKSMVTKIKASLQHLENLGFNSKPSDVKKPGGKKRDSTALQELHDDDEISEERDLKASAIEALALAEKELLEKSSIFSNASTSRNVVSDLSATTSGGLNMVFSMSGETELAPHNFDSFDSNPVGPIKLADIQAISILTRSSVLPHIGSSNNDLIFIEPISAQSPVYSQLAVESLLRILASTKQSDDPYQMVILCIFMNLDRLSYSETIVVGSSASSKKCVSLYSFRY
jgi:hypothetical protein